MACGRGSLPPLYLLCQNVIRELESSTACGGLMPSSYESAVAILHNLPVAQQSGTCGLKCKHVQLNIQAWTMKMSQQRSHATCTCARERQRPSSAPVSGVEF